MIGPVLILSLFVAAAASGQGYLISQEEFSAIQGAESGGCRDPLNAVGDSGTSIGPYQITRGYFSDAASFNPSLLNGGKTWESTKGPGSLEFSQMVMQSYSNRYCTEARLGREPTFDDFARMHNGGPNGHRNPNTLMYLEKVKSFLNGEQQFYTGSADCSQAPQMEQENHGSRNQGMNVLLLFILVLLVTFAAVS